MKHRAPVSNVRSALDQVLVDIANYVLDYKIAADDVLATARLCLTDTLAGALDADYPECCRLVGPLVPGTVVPNGSRIPGTRHEVDPATAAFGFGCMIRWLDFNDQFSGRQGSHPSDDLAGILMLADHLSRNMRTVCIRTARRGVRALRSIADVPFPAYCLARTSCVDDCSGTPSATAAISMPQRPLQSKYPPAEPGGLPLLTNR
jgi:hypothetical protein